MYAIEKSLRNAAVTRIRAARNTAAKVAIPARRAVSLSRAEPAPFVTSATNPPKNAYPLRASASRSAKLPSWDMLSGYFFKLAGVHANHAEWASHASGSGAIDLTLSAQRFAHFLNQFLWRAGFVQKSHAQAGILWLGVIHSGNDKHTDGGPEVAE